MGLLDFLPEFRNCLLFIPLKIGVIIIALLCSNHIIIASIVLFDKKTEECRADELNTVTVLFSFVLAIAAVFFLFSLCFKSYDFLYIFIWIFFSVELYLFLHGMIIALDALKKSKECFKARHLIYNVISFVVAVYSLVILNSYKHEVEKKLGWIEEETEDETENSEDEENKTEDDKEREEKEKAEKEKAEKENADKDALIINIDNTAAEKEKVTQQSPEKK